MTEIQFEHKLIPVVTHTGNHYALTLSFAAEGIYYRKRLLGPKKYPVNLPDPQYCFYSLTRKEQV